MGVGGSLLMSESYTSCEGWVVRRTQRTEEYSLLLPFSMVWEIKMVTGGMLLTFREKTREEWRAPPPPNLPLGDLK